MSSTYSVLLLTFAALTFGRLARVFSLPAMAGEIAAGLVLGPALLGVIERGPAVAALSDLAVFVIVISAALEVNISSLTRAFRGAGLPTALFSFTVSCGAGFLVGRFFSLNSTSAIVMGLCMSTTALPVALQILSRFRLLGTRVAHYTIASALVSDVLIFLALGFIIQNPNGSNGIATGITIATCLFKLAGLLAVLWCAKRVLDAALRRGHLKVRREIALIAYALGAFAFGRVSAWLGIHFLIGTFLGALLLGNAFESVQLVSKISPSLKRATEGVFAPFFFASIGLAFSMGGSLDFEMMFLVVIVAGVSRTLTAWIGGRICGLGNGEAWALGVISNSRGVMGLIVIGLAMQHALIDERTYSVLLVMDIVTTLLAPVLLQMSWRQPVSISER